MLGRTRARLRRRRGRLAVVCTVALLGLTVATAHTSIGADHTGEAAAMCLAVLMGGAAVAGLQALRGHAARRRRPLRIDNGWTGPLLQYAVPHPGRGDPAVLQVFRR